MPPVSSTKRQLFPFAFVGTFSTIMHLVFVTIMVQFLTIKPLIANIIAYVFTVNVSYLGHRYITFANMGTNVHLRLLHYYLISIFAFLLNEFLYFLFLSYTPINYFTSLVIVMALVAIFTFVTSKWWACR